MTMIVCENFFGFYIFLLTAHISKKSHILPVIYFTFLNKRPGSIPKTSFNTKIGPQ